MLRQAAAGVLSICGLLGAAAVVADEAAVPVAQRDSPRAWLQRMNEALTSRNYDGTFFHVRDGRVETLRIIHRVHEGEVRERLVSLDGSGREFIRQGGELVCYLPDQQTVLVERRAEDGPLLGNLPRFDDGAAELYDFRSAEPLRFNGRDARLVSVTPRDAFRYGYRIWIDERTAMPLKTQLCDDRGRVIEQIVFSSLALSSRIPDSAFAPQLSTDGFRWLRQDSRGPVAAASLSWGALRLPPGFRMLSQGLQRMPGAERPVAHLVFSDGVASVSVFVESPREGVSVEERRGGAANLGSSAAYSTFVDGYQVTAVGEVPAKTVRFIAGQVRAARSRPSPGPPAAAPPSVQVPAFAPSDGGRR